MLGLEARVHRILKRLLHVENGLSISWHDVLLRAYLLICCLISCPVSGLVFGLLIELPSVIYRLVDIGVNVLASYASQIDDFTFVLSSILLIFIDLIDIDSELIATCAVFNSPQLVYRIQVINDPRWRQCYLLLSLYALADGKLWLEAEVGGFR